MPPRPATGPQSGFTLKGTQFLLTYPQCNVTKEDCLARLLSMFAASSTNQRPTEIIVGQEKHATGELHLHVALKFTQRFQTRLPSFFDFPTGKHGNYKPVQNWRKTVLYATKEDTSPCLWGITAEQLQTMKLAGQKKAAPKVQTEVARLCQEKVPLKEIAQRHPAFFMMNQTKIAKFHYWVNAPLNQDLPSWPGIVYTGSRPATARLVLWIQLNLFQPRPFKAPQLYLHGPPNSGKTSFVMLLETWTRIYHVPQFENFYALYDDAHDLIFYDEFKGQKKLQFMNILLQGGRATLAVKGSQYPKVANLPVIIASNFSPQEAYRNTPPAILETFLCRLSVIELDEKLDFENIEFRSPSLAESERSDALLLSRSDQPAAARLPGAQATRPGFSPYFRPAQLDDLCLCPYCAELNRDCVCPERRPPQA